MNIEFIIVVVVFVILLSFQYTLNAILVELKEIKNILKKQRIYQLLEEREDESDQE